jgi:osmotically-inducible protein OsmY
MEDFAVGSRVRAQLALNPSTSHLEFEVTARRGRIALQGRLTGTGEFEEVRRVAQAVPGVVDLDLDALSMPSQA